ncbi:alpha/beta hydrolase family protein [Rhizobium gallicum]|uniref:Alpha/beta hydrolase family protein n=1 Tax=Rhizobium gallicum TaxID=56730 RepID=A0A1L5NHL2_9HYPH|nr:alpha/beta-hydrolase family protein [Rhizobium gallicum]APO67362.1 alpha/beta hydrolase family protein [Rhizobium gallicum]
MFSGAAAVSQSQILRLWKSFSAAGLLIGALFFAASLTPTLLPRTFVTQGVLSGFSFAAGYGLGVFGRWLAHYLELPEPKDRTLLIMKLVAAVACVSITVAFLWRASAWQNSIRELMGLESVDTAHPLEVGLIAALTFALLLVLARLFQLTFLFTSRRLNRFVPRRVSYVVGIAIAVALFWSVINGVLFKFALHAADSSFQAFDELIEPERQQPTDPSKTGSAASLIEWDELGRAGREFIATGPTGKDLQSFLGTDALEPIRVYVGLRSAETAEARAKLAVEELKRAGGFERSVLIVVMPTGTGWIDPAAMDTVEYLHAGDVASIAMQYSYLTSWLSLLVEPGYGADAARALFAEVYAHWTRLPKESRPRLYLHGLSLGALSSEQSAELFEVIGDPYHGALWSGPPFPSRIWRAVTDDRVSGSPAWLPRFRDGSYVRFTSQQNALALPGAHWGPMRIVYLQYASDPVTFFDYRSLYRNPEWMIAPRGPDVSSELRWYPVVTLLQLTLDMAMATTAPIGYGHVYAPAHYIDAWIEVTDLQGWRAEQIARLKHHFERQQ